MKVVCVSNKAGWDDFHDATVEIGKTYTAIGTCIGYGRFNWWPYSKCLCYELAGFPPEVCFPVKQFIEIQEDEEMKKNSELLKIVNY